MKDSSHSIATRGGTGNTNNTGDGNTFLDINGDLTIDLNFSNRKPLNRTALFTFCEAFSEVDSVEDNEFPLASPSKFLKKMDYNELQDYKQIFEGCALYYNDVELVLSQFTRREKIPNSIHKVYKKILKNYHSEYNADLICYDMAEELLGIIHNDVRSLDEKLGIDKEDFELAIDALMYYTFTKCKILRPVPKNITEEE